MRESARTFLFLMLVLLPGLYQTTTAQTQLVLDNRKLDSLTKAFKSYSVTVFVNESESNVGLQEIVSELKRHFKFLRSKKQRSAEADFEIRIDIWGKTVGSIQHAVSAVTSQDGTIYNHQYTLSHIATARLSIISNGKDLAKFGIDSNVIFQRKYSYTEVKNDYKWMKDQSEAANRRLRDDNNAASARAKVDELWRFEKDFFELFKNYRERIN